MGWVSFLEDIEKRTADLESMIEGIQKGAIAYTDPNRAKVADVARQIRNLVGDLQANLRRLGPEDSRRVDEILGFDDIFEKIMIHGF